MCVFKIKSSYLKCFKHIFYCPSHLIFFKRIKLLLLLTTKQNPLLDFIPCYTNIKF